jgi:hypothetical protein
VGLENPDFVSMLGELIDELETDPKQFPPKKGRLAARAPMRFPNDSCF